MTDIAASSAVAAPPAERIAPRRLVAFLIMVFGMFMSILDIQVVSASLTDIQPGLSASSTEVSWVQTAYLIAEVIAIPLSGFLSRALGTRVLFAISAAGFTASGFLRGLGSTVAHARDAVVGCDFGGRFHRFEFSLRLCRHDRADDPVARDPGLSRRGHDP